MIRTKSHVLILFTVAVAASLLYFYFDPSLGKFFPSCPFYTITGLFCPGCGSQRAFHELLHGHIINAAAHNLLFVLFTPLMLFSAIVTANNIFRRQKIGQAIFHSTPVAITVFLAVIFFWIARNIPFEPFAYLAPGI
jgi:hypothetical protein